MRANYFSVVHVVELPRRDDQILTASDTLVGVHI